MYVRMYIRVYVCVHLFTYVRMGLRLYVRVTETRDEIESDHEIFTYRHTDIHTHEETYTRKKRILLYPVSGQPPPLPQLMPISPG